MTTSASILDQQTADILGLPLEKPQPVRSSLAAAASRLTNKTVKRVGQSKAEEWQDDAWDMFDLVGEQRFLASTLANRMGQARFFVGKRPKDSTEEVEPITEGPAYDVFQSVQGKGQFGPIATRAGLNLFMPGDCYLVGIPPKQEKQDASAVQRDGINPLGGTDDTDPLAGIDLDTLDWRLLSISECKVDSQSGEVTLTTDKGESKHQADDIVLIRVWRPHPRHWWKADSPTRSSLPVLRELVGLTMHISAQVDSRLAGAGIFLVPASADAALRAAAQQDDEEGDGDDISPLAEALMDAMTTAIEDRGSASAIVPIMPVVPDETIEKFRFISFAGPLDQEARSLRDEAIRRLALGQDCPPELLLGVGGMNHWGAWLVREDVVTTHLEPPLALLCDAITTQLLWPVLELQGVADYEEFVVWYDVDHLISRPNRAEDAKFAKTAGIISDSSTRDALGFDESDAPDVMPTDPIKELVLEMLRTAPSLAVNPGLPVLAQQIQAMLDGELMLLPGQEAPAEGDDVEDPSTDEQGSTEGGTPATAEDPAPTDESMAASAAADMEEVL